MRVFVVGASGAIGARLVRELIAGGHEVIGTFRTPEKKARLRALGAEAIALDLLHAHALRDADRLVGPSQAGAHETNAGMAYLDQAVTDAGGIALRYGGFYGNADDQLTKLVRKRRYPMIGNGEGVTSWIHLDDAAAATVLALEHGEAGIYNIVDDEPAPTRERLPVLAKALVAKPPRHIPAGIV